MERIETVNPFDRAVELLLALLLVFMPLAFGVEKAWSRQVVLALVAAMSLAFVLKLVTQPQTPWVRSWAIVPAVLFLFVAALQIIPLPVGLIRVLSPHTAATWHDLLGDLPTADALLAHMTLSFYPHVTWHDLRLVLAGLTVFVVVLNVFRTPDRIKWLLTVITLTGGGVALLAIAQVLTGTQKIYWLIPLGYAASAGPFANHSHFAQFMNLSIGAGLALLMVQISEAFHGRPISPSEVTDYLGSPVGRRLWAWGGICVLGAASIFVCLSRGGIIGMLAALAFTTLMMVTKRSLWGRAQLMALITLAAFACVLYIGFDAVYERMATLRALDRAEGGRWQIVQDIARAWTRFPLFGTGLGTHAIVYPMFDRSTIASLASHAENEYAQTIEETGLVGFLGLLVFGVMAWLAYVRSIRRGRQRPIHVAAYGLGFGLLAILVQSLSDFGQHLPANFILSMVFCALLFVLAGPSKARPAHASQAHWTAIAGGPRHWTLALRVLALVGIGAVWTVVLIGANRTRLAQAQWNQAMDLEQVLMDRQWQGTDQEYIELITHTESAAHHQPRNAEYRYWLNAYRWRSISRVTDPNTGEIALVPQAVEFTRRIIGELNQARVLCPTYGPTYCLMGEMERLVQEEDLGCSHIETGYRLAPCDPTVCLVTGLLDAQKDRIDQGFAKLSRAVALDRRLFAEVCRFLVLELDRPELAVALAGDDIGRLTQTANLLAGLPEGQVLSQQVRSQVVQLLRDKASQPDAPAGVYAALAGMCRQDKDFQSAIENYRKALVLDYGQVGWRYSLAALLAQENRPEEALEEARICLRFQPGHTAAKRLIEKLSVQPQAANK